MEANLNQFRNLLTVRGEQEANARRGSCSGCGRPRLDGTRGVSSDSSSNGSSNGSARMLSTLPEQDHESGHIDDSPLSAHSSPRRLRPDGRHPETASDDGDLEMSDGDEDEATEADRPKTDDAERSLISALKSLEQTLNDHTMQLTKRLRREVTIKGVTSETPVQVAASPLPTKTGQRGDKVELSVVISSNNQWLKCNGTQWNAVPPTPIYGLKRSPLQIVIMLGKGTRPLSLVGGPSGSLNVAFSHL